MHKPILLFASVMLLSSVALSQSKSGEMKAVNVKRITPVLYAKEIEPCLEFWIQRLGFQKTVEVPDGDRLAFAIVQKGDVELMYQSIASAEKDAPAIAKDISGQRTFLYVEVARLDDVIAAIKGLNIVLPVRTTFYGAKEIGIKDPAGHMIVFAEMGAAPQH
ncbi:MAG TPA: VOC family protein [Terriglobales bacterium]